MRICHFHFLSILQHSHNNRHMVMKKAQHCMSYPYLYEVIAMLDCTNTRKRCRVHSTHLICHSNGVTFASMRDNHTEPIESYAFPNLHSGRRIIGRRPTNIAYQTTCKLCDPWFEPLTRHYVGQYLWRRWHMHHSEGKFWTMYVIQKLLPVLQEDSGFVGFRFMGARPVWYVSSHS